MQGCGRKTAFLAALRHTSVCYASALLVLEGKQSKIKTMTKQMAQEPSPWFGDERVSGTGGGLAILSLACLAKMSLVGDNGVVGLVGLLPRKLPRDARGCTENGAGFIELVADLLAAPRPA